MSDLYYKNGKLQVNNYIVIDSVDEIETAVQLAEDQANLDTEYGSYIGGIWMLNPIPKYCGFSVMLPPIDDKPYMCCALDETEGYYATSEGMEGWFLPFTANREHVIRALVRFFSETDINKLEYHEANILESAYCTPKHIQDKE